MDDLYEKMKSKCGPGPASKGVLAQIHRDGSDEELTVDCIRQYRVPAPVPLRPLPVDIKEPVVTPEVVSPIIKIIPVVRASPEERLLQAYDQSSRGIGRSIQETSTQRILAHVLMYIAYRAPHMLVVSVDDVYQKMDKVCKDIYGIPTKRPTDSTLGNVMSNLRNGLIQGIPNLVVAGPKHRWVKDVNGKFFKQEILEIEPRDARKDKVAGIVLAIPDWCFPRED